MFHKPWNFLFLLLFIAGATALTRPVSAGPQPQVVYQTPTAQPDGRVIYIVQPGDTCLRIQLLTNNATTIDQLRALNKLDQGCTLRDGQELLLAVITPTITPTVDPNVTPTIPPPTPTPFTGSGSICVLLYDDINGDAVREVNELFMPGGAVSISNRSGSVSVTRTTTAGIEPICEEVPEGEYNISMAIPGGHNATTTMNLAITLQAGDQAILEFGAQKSSIVEAAQQPEEESKEPLLAILGGVFVLFGIALGLYIAVRRR